MKGLTQTQKLAVYEVLRDMHKLLKDYPVEKYEGMNPTEQNAIDAVHSVLYLAENLFAKIEI